MSDDRLAAAAVVMLCLVYLKLSMPPLYEESLSAVKEALDTEQISLPVSEATAAWIVWE